MAKTKYQRVRLTGVLPFASLDIPGSNPSVVVSRDFTTTTTENVDALKKAIKAGRFAPATEKSIEVESVKESAEEDPAADKK